MFGDYEVVRELGRGGMGAVYLVRDPSDGAEFAVKVMFPTVNDSMSVRRFIREAEIAMTVKHPNLVHVHEVGRDPDTGLGYMVMDYAGGGSLRDLLLRRLASGEGPLSPREAISILRPVASALAAAEARGVVHRDIKPDNILFTSAGVPLLADLGVAKKSAGEDDSTLLTMSDVIVGTPAYMAPEQMTNSHAVDSRADVYSLGLVLWEMLVGERPTAGASAAELMARAIRGERISDITTRLPRTPRLIVELVRGMTEPMPEKRIPGPAAVLEFVDEWRSRERRRFKTWLAAVIVFSVLVLSAVLAGGIWYVRRELSASREGSAAPSHSRVNDLSADDVGDAVDSVFGNL
jgi:serine/threonine protein kinase